RLLRSLEYSTEKTIRTGSGFRVLGSKLIFIDTKNPKTQSLTSNLYQYSFLKRAKLACSILKRVAEGYVRAQRFKNHTRI
ncbi:MAG: hypothetical protein JSV49_07375, partial [Thermoplasmata archaeon]